MKKNVSEIINEQIMRNPILSDEEVKELTAPIEESAIYDEARLNEEVAYIEEINEDGSIDFDKFALLTESEQISYMEKWTPQQKMQYLMQNTISEEECFGPVLKLINEIEEGKFNDSSI